MRLTLRLSSGQSQQRPIMYIMFNYGRLFGPGMAQEWAEEISPAPELRQVENSGQSGRLRQIAVSANICRALFINRGGTPPQPPLLES